MTGSAVNRTARVLGVLLLSAVLILVSGCGTRDDWARLKAEAEVAVPRAPALAFSESFVRELIVGETGALFQRMDRRFRDSATEKEFASVVRGLAVRAGKIRRALYRDDELGYRTYLDGTRSPMRRFWYAVETEEAEMGQYYLYVDVVLEAGQPTCTTFAILNSEERAPVNLQ